MFILWNPFWPQPPTKVWKSLRQAVRIRNAMLAKEQAADLRILEITPPDIKFVSPERIAQVEAELTEEATVEHDT